MSLNKQIDRVHARENHIFPDRSKFPAHYTGLLEYGSTLRERKFANNRTKPKTDPKERADYVRQIQRRISTKQIITQNVG